MCGISGIITRTSSELLSHSKLKSMNDAIAHRGPDGEGTYIDGNVGFGHRRLSILDLSENGKQPMSDNSNQYAITYNGEIYNHLAIRKDLENSFSFKGNSDTETILNGFIKNGTDLFKQLNGIFAFAVHDKLAQKVYLVRDRLGVKPLYYTFSKDHLIFASEKKAILKHSNKTKLNYNGLQQYLYYGYVHKDETMIANIKKLLPGNVLELDLQTFNMTIWPYWKHEDVLPVQTKYIESDLVKKTSYLLEKAVKSQLQSDVSVGVFLSGGIDSSAIVAYASKHYTQKLNTYSAAFDFDDGHNELPLAKKVAQKFNTNHHEFFIKGNDLPDITEKLVTCHDEPFSDAANIPLYLMSKEVKKTSPVILQGDGGDELFGGYPRYHLLNKSKLFLSLFKLLKPYTKLPSYFPKQKGIARLHNIYNSTLKHESLAKLLTLEERKSNPENIFSLQVQDKINNYYPFGYYKELYERFNMLQGMDQKLLWLDTLIILPDLFLEKVDKSTMSNSIEVRVPFLDNDLLSFALSLPSKIKLKNGVQKHLLKEALRGLIPDAVLFGKKKGFGVPYSNWLKGPLKNHFYDVVFSKYVKELGFFNHNLIQKMYTLHESGKADYGNKLWKIYNLSMWLEKYKITL